MEEVFGLFMFGAGACAALVGMYFFIATRGSLMIQKMWSNGETSYIYWIYKSRFLIWLTDHQSVVSLVLLGNYSKMVGDVIKMANASPTHDKEILQVGCAFGNLSERILTECMNTKKVVITDIIKNELDNSRDKVKALCGATRYEFVEGDATQLPQSDRSFDCVIGFFLLHELPYKKKVMALTEAARVLKPGGRIIFGEFHKPHARILKVLGIFFFGAFEPYAKEMWGLFDPHKVLRECTHEEWKFRRKTYLLGNYQVMVAEKKA
ncbi:MAG: methyltransferase domain-containing protein [Patescibacteria group bacterium]